jgi:valyl-tRNA synthetase
MELPKSYSHKDLEAKWYRRWTEAGAFAPANHAGRYFSMVIPPPNVTGSLHIGHALNNTLQDILCRYKRMDGYRVLWVPGTDHAGIATQNVVERQLAEEGLTRAQLGRAKFIERVWAWRKQSGSTILHQLKALGASCDWSHERFTMDEGLSQAVRETFVRLCEDGLLYRAERLINWCPRCKTALADIEVTHEEVDGSLWHIVYPLWDDPSKGIEVATTRPETMLGDTAVAVHPDDERWREFIGKSLRLPIVGRRIPVIAAPFVDREFGTGALKITPAHDFNDFEIGEKHNLKRINIFDAEARIAPEAFVEEFGQEPVWMQRYFGKERYEARKLVEAELQERQLLKRRDRHRHAVGKCYRCSTPIEPYMTPQWFVRTKPLAAPAIEAVREGRIRIVPEGWANSYFAWMENIKDWCISRQIWWGHQIPAWYCAACNEQHISRSATGDYLILKGAQPIVGREAPKSCPGCGGADFLQDPDVLDTWFSSALWPFSTLGWPQATDDLKSFYPTSALVTSFDILFFWVARMIMMGLKFMGDVPFRDVYIHALVRDQEGQKMSKSKGNVIDPLAVMERYGADAFRFTLAALAAMGRDVKLAEERIQGYQNFVNKLWNAARFVLMNLTIANIEAQKLRERLDGEKLNPADQWILSRLAVTIGKAREAIDSYRFNEYAHHLYQFTWHEFCDWYIEMSKLALNSGNENERLRTERVLAEVLENILRLLHPVMPFVTEEIWQALREKLGAGKREEANGKSGPILMLQPYPGPEPKWAAPEVEERINLLMEVTRAVRNLRAEMNVAPSKEVSVTLVGADDKVAFLRSHESYLRALARVSRVEYLTDGARPKGAATAVVGEVEVYVPLGDMVNVGEEKTRLEKELSRTEEELARVRRKLGNSDFVAKAKENVVRREKEKAEEFQDKIRTLHLSLGRLGEIEQIGEKP